MRMLIQRVKKASVSVEGEVCGKIDKGLLVFFAVHKDDTPDHTAWLANKLVTLRIFADEEGKMNRCVKDVSGQVLVVSQFTLYGNCRNGRRPDFIDSAPPDLANRIYEQFVSDIKKEIDVVHTGKFGAYMEVDLTNDGPVTFLIDKS